MFTNWVFKLVADISGRSVQVITANKRVFFEFIVLIKIYCARFARNNIYSKYLAVAVPSSVTLLKNFYTV